MVTDGSSSAREWLRRPRPVSRLLMLMSLAVVLPALAFSGILINQSSEQQRSRTENRLVQVAADLANDIDREFARLLAFLETIVRFEALERGDLQAFHALTKEVTSRLPANVIVLDPETMQMLANTGVPWGSPLPKTADPAAVERALASMAPVVSDLFYGPLLKVWTINVLVPFPIGERARYVVMLAVDARHFTTLMRGQHLPAEWVTGVSDRRGVIIARSKEFERTVGQPLPEPLLEQSRTAVGPFAAINVMGEATLRAVATSQTAGWLVSANVPAHLVDADIKRKQLALVLGGICLLIAAVGLASILGRWISMPMQDLATSAAGLRARRIVPQLNSPVTEANDIAAALREASIALKSQVDRLRESESRLSLAHRTARLAHIDVDLRTRKMTVSQTFPDILGFVAPSSGDIGEAMATLLPLVQPDDRDRVAALHAEIVQTVGAFSDEFGIVLGDGRVRSIAVQGETVDDGNGRPARIIATALDITRHKEQEQHVRFLLREVSHRSKNLLAIIQAMAKQTARSSPSYAEFEVRFGKRLQAMAFSQDLLVNQDWQGVDVATLIRTQLRPFADEASGRLALKGASVTLRPAAAESLGLALHELATNATKHGSLQAAAGRVHVDWRIDRQEGNSIFELTWTENGGPAATPPTRKGFGHTVFERMIAQSLGGTIAIDYRQDGFRWRLVAPLEQIVG